MQGKRWVILLCVGLFGCTDVTPNNPYPEEEAFQNVFYSAFSARPRFLDPARSYSADESTFTAQIYEPPLQYHYLKRPYTLMPETTVSMPTIKYLDKNGHPLNEVSDPELIAFTVYRIQIQPGIMYAPHPAFAVDGQGIHRYFDMKPDEISSIKRFSDFKEVGSRELKAEDYVYEIKRLASPAVASPIFGLMQKYIVGMKEFNQRLQQRYDRLPDSDHIPGRVDLRSEDLPGARVIDDYTYEITIVGKYPQFIYWLAMPFFCPIPWEADVFYAQKALIEKNIVLDWYPVGTGPYMLVENNPNRRMRLARNPHYRIDPYPGDGVAGDAEHHMLDDAGKSMPFLDGAIFSLEKESIPLWTKFLQGYYDSSAIASDNFEQALTLNAGQAALTPALKEKGIELLKSVELSDYYWGFNMLDPLVGGYSVEQQKLRQAISIAIDTEEYISIFLNDRAIPAQSVLPPGLFGSQTLPDGLNTYIYDWVDGKAVRKPISLAKQLLTEAGYPNGINAKTKQPLVITYDAISRDDPLENARFAWLRKQFAKLNIELNVDGTDYNRFQDKLDHGTFQFFNLAWLADYPDAENFLFILYGANSKATAEGANSTNYNSPEFNSLFERAQSMDDTDERKQVIHQLVAISQKDAPWVWGFHPETYTLTQPWLSNIKPNDMIRNGLKYYRIDAQERESLRNRWNQPLIWPILIVLLLIAVTVMPVVWMYRHKERYQKPKRYTHD